MATYAVKINEQTKEGRSLLTYLKSLGVIAEEGSANYDPKFVSKIKQRESEPSIPVDIDNLF